ncbi:MAG: hypothetical protein V1772_11485 [Chloroflexota bacterium]
MGELQNALPRWGTIHFTGYPLYTLLGSAFVSLLRLVGIAPAAGASLYSALWGAAALVGLALLAMEVGAPPPLTALGSLIAGLSLSNWVDASLAEVHTMTMALTVGSLYWGARFSRTGGRRELLWLTFFFTQGAAHMRAVIFLAPALGVLAWPHWRVILRHWAPAMGVALLAPLTYLYLPIRAWQGATWTFNEPGTWRGFVTMIGDTKSGRIVAPPTSLGDALARLHLIAQLVHADLPWPVAALGLLGAGSPALRGQRRVALALGLTAVAYLAVGLIVWEGRISDALLAVKLPAIYVAGLGLAAWGILLRPRSRWRPALRGALAAVLVALCAALVVRHRPQVLAITRDPAAEVVIRTVEATPRDPARPTTFMALWGHDYWALAYAQAYRGELAGLCLVDHNAPFDVILARGDRLMTLDRTFYQRSLDWWDGQLGRAYLSAPAPGIVEIAAALRPVPAGMTEAAFDLGNGIRIAGAKLRWQGDGQLALALTWLAERAPAADYSVGVHLLAHDPPGGPADILAQADRQHPVAGWYPTSRWAAGELVEDCYALDTPSGSQPVAVRVGMYRVNAGGEFENTPWLSLPIPE